MVGHTTKNSKWRLIYGLVLLLVSLRWAVPEDLFTSAYALDNLGIQQTFSNASMLFGPDSFFYTGHAVSSSAAGFSLFLFALQLAIGFQAAQFAYWGKNVKEEYNNFAQFLIAIAKGKKIDEFGWGKLLATLSYWAIAMCDTYFDASFKSFGGDPSLFGLAFVISFLYYSIGSEFGMTLGFNWVADAIKELTSQPAQVIAPRPRVPALPVDHGRREPVNVGRPAQQERKRRVSNRQRQNNTRDNNRR